MLLETAAIVIVVVLLLLVASFLLIPLRASFLARREGGYTEGELSVRWLGIRVMRRRVMPAPARTKEAPEEERRANPLRMLVLLRDALPSVMVLVRAFRLGVSVRRLSATVDLGLGDPAETAYVSGCIWAVSWALNRVPGVSFVLRPDLERARLEGSAEGEASVWLLPLVVGFLRAYRRKAFRELMKEARRAG